MPSALVHCHGTESIRTVVSQGKGDNMARTGDRIRPALGRESGSIISAVLVFVIGLTVPSPCEAAKLGEYLTRKDLSRPLLLDQNGNQLQLHSPSHPHPSVTQGSTPTYLALHLYGGEHLPVAMATIDAGAEAGSTGIGPLDLNTLVKAQLDAALNQSGLAQVDAPKQNYLVEYLPHIARSHQDSAVGSATSSTTSVTKGHKTSNSSTSDLSKLLSASQWDTWTKSGLSDLKKLLNINSSNSNSGQSNSKPSLNIQAQVLGSANQASEAGTVLPSPIPEPSGWMVFTLLLTAALATAMRRGQMLTTA